MFDDKVQTEPNGPWADTFRDRVIRVKQAMGLSLAALGEHFGFSGQFVHNLLSGKPNGRMHSKHTTRVVEALEKLEMEAGLRERPNQAPEDGRAGANDLASMVKKINEMGFSVTLCPLK